MFSIRNSSLSSKVESSKLARALGSCFVLFGTLQLCVPTELGGNKHATSQLETKSPTAAPRVPVLDYLQNISKCIYQIKCIRVIQKDDYLKM